ncbi:hypothetical protein HMI55_004255 [Coelomomyces lativittatus]|nr:hypothetical protein HMI55_004255 [Coelomomyces lativittatus]KAJ1508626.1 hypothetical protein HMI56_007200 [Coelomomyces lativittatus]
MTPKRTSFSLLELANSHSDLPKDHLVRTYGFLTGIDLVKNEAHLIEDGAQFKVNLALLDPESIPKDNLTLVHLGGSLSVNMTHINATWIRSMGDVDLPLYKRALRMLFKKLKKDVN